MRRRAPVPMRARLSAAVLKDSNSVAPQVKRTVDPVSKGSAS
jgi:hypothetical protein